MARTSHSGFTGACPDPITAAYPLGNGYRWFVSALMRFNARDDLSPFGPGGINPYAYCTGDPVNYGDPSGHIGLWGDIIEASFHDAVTQQRESRLPDADSYQEAKQQYADDLAKYMQHAMDARDASSPSTGPAPAPPPPFAFDAWHEQPKQDSTGPALAQTAAAADPPSAGPRAADTFKAPRPRRLRRRGVEMKSSQAFIVARIAAAIPRESLTFALILEHVTATPFRFIDVERVERQTMDRFIGVLAAHGIRASELPDYTYGNVFKRFSYRHEDRPRLGIEMDIRKGRDVRANRDRLYWLGFDPPDPAG
ncbi:RHS repeat-associated core domain-containing protein [Bordetella bronchialis]|uniref:RHS repeat-associated core domain-containing protein n=1 Tax=Bordetella bronchialis TaxID=463025 RepID=UPI003CFECE12